MPRADRIRITIRITIPITIPVTRIQATRTRPRLTRIQLTWGHLQCARMDTMIFTPMPVYPMATMDQAGSPPESLLASGPGAAAGAVDTAALAADIAAGAVDVSMAVGATTETGRPLPDAEDFAVGSVADVASVEAADVAPVEGGMEEAEVEVVPMVVGADRLHH